MSGALIGRDQLGNPYSVAIDSPSGDIITTRVQNQSPTVADTSVSITAMGLITSALRLASVLASGEQPDINMANEALVVLDQMVDGWNAERLLIYTTRADDFALTAGQQSYTLGPGGDFNTNRPSQIDNMSTVLLSNPTNPIEVPIQMYTVDEWRAKLPVKNVTGSFPLVCYDDGGFPQRGLTFWPIPTQACAVRIYSWQSLGLSSPGIVGTDQLGSSYSVTVQSGEGGLQVQTVKNQFPLTLQTAMSFPPGYAEAFRYNLTVRLAAEFASPLSPTVQALAVEALARLKTMNAPELKLRSDLVGSRGAANYRAELFGLGW